MINYEAIAETAVQSIIKNIKEECVDQNFTYNKAVIIIDVDKNQLNVTVVRKDPIGIEYDYTETVDLK